MSSTQEELKLTPLQKQRKEENEKFAEIERDETKRFEAIRAKGTGAIIPRGVGYLLVMKTGALIGAAADNIYKFWQRQMRTPLMIVVSDDPTKVSFQLKDIVEFKRLDAQPLKKLSSMGVALFKRSEVTDAEIAYFRNFAQTKFNRPILTLALENPATDVSILEVHQ